MPAHLLVFGSGFTVSHLKIFVLSTMSPYGIIQLNQMLTTYEAVFYSKN